MKKPLEIRLIGAFSVIDDAGKVHTIPGRKDRAVLAFLAAHPGRPIARERLVELIWPGAADGAGRASLRQSLSVIRKALSPFKVLCVGKDTVALDAEIAATDVGRLENHESARDLIRNAPLTNGETFLDDLGGVSADFDTWRATEHSRIRSLVANMLDDLATRAETSNTSTAAAALSQLVSLDPLNEVAQRRYMRSLIVLGQANAAIRQYRKLEGALQDELGVQPDEETRAIFAEAKTKAVSDTLAGPPETPAPESETASRATLPTIIVYPFRDLSGDEENRHFAEGLSDSITAALSLVSGLKVIARPTASREEAQAETSADIHGDQAEVFALHGTVRILGDRLRAGAQLIGQPSGRVYWAEDYNRELNDIFAIQDDITFRIAVEMRVKLSEGEKIRVLAKYTRNVEAWSRLIRADVLINTLVEEDNIEARRLLEDAIQIDPACAAAWGELADSYIGDYMMGRRSLPKEQYLEKAMDAAGKALEIEPCFTHAHNVISLVQAFRGEFSKATETSRDALIAAPRNPEIAANCAYALALCSHAEEALEVIKRAISTTPIPPMWYQTVEGICLYMLGEYQAAIRRLQEAVKLVPDSAFARPYLVGALMEHGLADEAAKVAEEIKRVQPDFALSTWPGANFADDTLGSRLTRNLTRAGIKR